MTSHRLRTLPVVLAASALLLAGCSSTAIPQASTQSSAPAAPVPADARSLQQLGLAHGPAAFTLPRSTQVETRIDQPNVVTLTFDRAGDTELSRWLATRLPDGWVVDANRNGSLLFHHDAWQGAFTCSAKLCALTLRQQA